MSVPVLLFHKIGIHDTVVNVATRQMVVQEMLMQMVIPITTWIEQFVLCDTFSIINIVHSQTETDIVY